MTSEPSAQHLLSTALKYLNSGVPDKAAEICTALLDKESTPLGDALHVLALAYRAQGQLDKAESAIKRAVKLTGNNASD